MHANHKLNPMERLWRIVPHIFGLDVQWYTILVTGGFIGNTIVANEWISQYQNLIDKKIPTLSLD